MRLSPRPFGSRSGGRLGVIYSELRPPLEAIHSVRDMAHSFPSPGSSAMRPLWSCPCRLRINPPGSPVDRHRSKKAWTREPAWLPSGPLIPGDNLKMSRVDAPRRLRPPPLAASLTTACSYPHWLGPRRHAEQQHFSQGPHMVSQPSGHGGCLELPAFGRAVA